MDPTTALIVIGVLILAERHAARSTMLARLALDLMRERQRAEDLGRRLREARDDLARRRALAAELRAAFLREVSPAMQRARLDPPAEVAGLLGRLSEEIENGLSDTEPGDRH